MQGKKCYPTLPYCEPITASHSGDTPAHPAGACPGCMPSARKPLPALSPRTEAAASTSSRRRHAAAAQQCAPAAPLLPGPPRQVFLEPGGKGTYTCGKVISATKNFVVLTAKTDRCASCLGTFWGSNHQKKKVPVPSHMHFGFG